jgi:transcriptional regulator with XRE-family HTH domain
MGKDFALINPKMITWARERADFSVAELAEKLKIPEQKLSGWETGEALPTFTQAQKIAKILYIPFGYLYLPSPPKDEPNIPDLRTKKEACRTTFSVDLKDVLMDTFELLSEVGAFFPSR